jgi:hypothetical protein
VVATLLQADGRCDARFPEALLPAQIGILYPWTPKSESPLLAELIKRLQTVAPVVWLHDDDRDRVSEPGIKVQTIHSSKGLQYRAVILLWADRLPRTFPDSDPEEERKLMYVALTRAEDYLFISSSEESEFIDRMRKEQLALAPTLDPDKPPSPDAIDLAEVIEEPPEHIVVPQESAKPWLSRKDRRIDFAERDAANRRLGRLDEEFSGSLRRLAMVWVTTCCPSMKPRTRSDGSRSRRQGWASSSRSMSRPTRSVARKMGTSAFRCIVSLTSLAGRASTFCRDRCG